MKTNKSTCNLNLQFSYPTANNLHFLPTKDIIQAENVKGNLVVSS